jgi:hypothetical protein
VTAREFKPTERTIRHAAHAITIVIIEKTATDVTRQLRITRLSEPFRIKAQLSTPQTSDTPTIGTQRIRQGPGVQPSARTTCRIQAIRDRAIQPEDRQTRCQPKQISVSAPRRILRAANHRAGHIADDAECVTTTSTSVSVAMREITRHAAFKW